MATEPTDLQATIQTAATTPQSASVDGQSATARPVADLILADQYAAAKYAMSKKHRGIRFNKILPAGPVSDQGGTRLGGSFGGGAGGLV